MRIAPRMLSDKTDHLKHLVHLLVDELLILDSLNNQPFRNNLTNRHSGVQRSNRILKDHLNLCNLFGIRMAMIISGRSPFLLQSRNFRAYIPPRRFRFRLQRLDFVIIGSGSCRYPVSFKVDISSCNIIQLNNGTSGCRLAAAGFSH